MPGFFIYYRFGLALDHLGTVIAVVRWLAGWRAVAPRRFLNFGEKLVGVVCLYVDLGSIGDRHRPRVSEDPLKVEENRRGMAVWRCRKESESGVSSNRRCC